MSHILDALQKLQEEKTAKFKQTTVTGGSLLDQPIRPKRPRNKPALVVCCLAVLLAGLVTWYALRSNQPKMRATQKPVVPVTSQRRETTAQAPPPAPPAATVLQPAPPSAAPPAAQQPTAPTAATQPAPPATPAEDDEGSSRRQRNKASGSTPVSPAPTEQPSTMPPVTAGTPDGIKLSGIAWHDTRKLRRAVVNDILVGEGAEVAGAKIVEIRPHLIRILKNGALFEVILPH